MTNGFDKLLRESLAAEPADGNGADCPDAAIVAAWFDGTLSAAERTAVEAHAAACARCQATIAALVRTDRPAPRAWWHAPAVQWLLPVAAAAGVSLIVWTGVLRRGDDAVPAPAATSARLESSSRASAGTPGPAEERGHAAPAERAREAVAPAQPARSPDAEARERLDERAQRARAAPARPVSAGAAKALPATSVDTQKAQANISPPPPQAQESVARNEASSLPPLAGLAGAAPPRPPGPASPRTEVQSAPPLIDAAGQSAERGFVQSVAGAAGRSGDRALVQSPDRSVRWRIIGQGRVERSIDEGLSWQVQTTGVNAVLVAGAAPSASVCWLVGGRGVVLKTTDSGQTWTRVAFPEEIDLVSVVADDDRVATVTAAGGRQLRTADGGGSWR